MMFTFWASAGNICKKNRLNEPEAEHTLCHEKDQGYQRYNDHNSALKIKKAVSVHL